MAKRGATQAAKVGWRKSADQPLYLRIWTRSLEDYVERTGPESDMVPEFHRLKAEGRVYRLELGGTGASRGPWISWDNPAFGSGVRCPHCGR